MITRDPQAFLAELSGGGLPADSPACPAGVMMVEPAGFRVSAETASDNAYMRRGATVDPARALQQFDALAELIRSVGLRVERFAGDPRSPDAVFPNNAFATAPGRLVIGHMLHPERQLETQRRDIREHFARQGYQVIDLSTVDCVAELTGVLVIDRCRRVGFCGMTRRVDQQGVEAMHRAFGLACTLQFDLAEGEYHTNVVLSVLAGRACVLHPASFADPRVPRALSAAYGERALELDAAEKDAFAGNCIALTPQDLFMSRTALAALRPRSLERLESWGFRVQAATLDEIEKAGGSLRCMLAEIY